MWNRSNLLGILTILSLLFLLNLAGCSTKETTAALEITEQEKIVKSFLQAINDKDIQKAEALLGPNMVYLEEYSDGTQDKFDNWKDIQGILTEIMDDNTRLTVDEFQPMNSTTLVAQGKASDYVTETVGLTKALRYTSKYTFQEGKISSMEFQRNKVDEELLIQKTKGTIGVALTDKDGKIFIEECLDGKSAQQAGLKVGDRIEAVDGQRISEMKYGIKESIYRIRGEVGTQVKLTINRDGKDFDVNIIRM